MRVFLAIFLFLLPASSAFAVGQGEVELTLGLGGAVVVQDTTRVGFEGDFRVLRGLTDSWAARLGLQESWLPASDTPGAMHVTTQAMGATWAADVLNLVPFADFGVLLADVRGGGFSASQRLGGQLALGADYLLSRHITVALVARIDYLPWRLAGGSMPTPVEISGALHLGRVF